MEKISVPMLTFLLNAAWQLMLVAVVAEAADRLLRSSSARYRHLLWVLALLTAASLPAITTARSLRRSAPTPRPASPSAFALIQPPLETVDNTPITPRISSPIASPRPSSPTPVQFPIPVTIGRSLIVLYVGFVLLRLAGLGRAWLFTRTLLRRAAPAEFAPQVARIVGDCQRRTGVERVRFLSSSSIAAPLTVRNSPAIVVLPAELLQEPDDALITSAIGHELIHVQRRDYLLNLIYQLLLIPLSFHPGATLFKRRIDQTRELRCDEIVTHRLLSPTAYARSLVELAGVAHALRPPATVALGIADADILEERIMSMLRKRRISSARRTLLLATAALVFTVPCIAAAPYALHINLHSTDTTPNLAVPAAPAVVPTAPSTAQEATAQEQAPKVMVEKTVGFAYAPGWQEQSQEESATRMKRKIAAEKVAQERETIEKKVAAGELAPEQAVLLKRKLEESLQSGEQQMTPEERAAREKAIAEKLAMRRRELAELSKAAKITMQQAIDAALRQQPGTVMESSLMGDRFFTYRTADGDNATFMVKSAEGASANPVYRIVILSGDENAPVRTLIMVSAIDGSILRTAVE